MQAVEGVFRRKLPAASIGLSIRIRLKGLGHAHRDCAKLPLVLEGRSMRRLTALVVIFLLLPIASPALLVPAWAGYEEGMAAAQQGDYATALREWKPLAKQGHMLAQYNIGVMYQRGYGVTKNFPEAVKWFREAAEQGHTSAQYELGVIFVRGGLGIPRNFAQASKWFGLAAAQGHMVAQYDLGLMHLRGEGMPQDYVKAMKWLEPAAVKGYAPAQYYVGLMYLRGDGVARDWAKGYLWICNAARQGHTLARDLLKKHPPEAPYILKCPGAEP